METVVDGKTMHDVHRMVVAGFSKPLISGFYILAMGLLFFHLRHGAASVWQTFGIRDRNLAKLADVGSWVLAVVLFLGFSSIPVAVWLGVWKS
jgi:succinate dehydrogenase / fumarate reductase cytochrome b subunit